MKGRIIKTWMWIIIGAIGMVNHSGCSSSFQYAPYSSRTAGLDVSLEYIAGWKFQETRGERGSYSHVIFVENNPREEMKVFMSVTAAPLSESAAQTFDLQSAADDLIEKRSRFKGFSVISRSAAAVAGLAAQEIVLEYQALNKLYRIDAVMVPVKERIVLCRKEDTLYSFTYQSPEKRFPAFNAAFDHMLATVELTKK